MYRIEFDPRRNVIAATLGGMMSVEETAAYIAELRDGFRRHRFQTGYRIMVDVSDCPIQSQGMIEAMRAHMETFPKASRIAMVVGGALARMQVRRLMTQPYAQTFETPDEGMAWLVSGETAQDPPAAATPGFPVAGG